MCPGGHFALPSVWITMTSILAAFDVSKAVDDAGNVVEPSYEYCNGPIACVPCGIYKVEVPLIFAACAECPFRLSVLSSLARTRHAYSSRPASTRSVVTRLEQTLVTALHRSDCLDSRSNTPLCTF